MKKLIFILIALISFSQAQTIQTIGAPTTTVVSRGNFRTDSIFYLPKRTKAPTDTAAFRYQISDSSLYYWTGYQWTKVQSATSFASVDTNIISTRAWRQKGDDSLGAIIATKGSGTVTSVATGYGLSGGTITTTGTLIADTLNLSTRAWRQKGLDSLAALEISGSGTTNYVPKFTGTSTIGNSSIIDNGSQIITNLTDIRLGNAVSTTDVSLKLGRTRTNNGFVFIDLIGDTTYSDYGFRLIRGNTGLNATSSLEHRGTGTFTINANESANVRINTSATERFTVLSTGNIGIGNTSPTSILTVGSNNSASTTPTSIEMDRSYRTGGIAFDKLKFYLYKDGTQSYGFGLGDLADVQYWAGSSSTGIHRFFTSQTERARLTSSGELLINTTTDAGAYTLQNNGALYNTGSATIGSTIINNNSPFITGANIYAGTNMAIGTNTSNSVGVYINSSELMRFNTNSRVGVLQSSPQYTLDVNGSFRGGGIILAQNSPFITGDNISGTGNMAIGTTGNSFMNFFTNNTEALRINSSGESLFGTTTDAGNYRVQVSGNAYVSGDAILAVGASSNNVRIGSANASNAKLFVSKSGLNTIFDSGSGSDARLEFHYNGSRNSLLNFDSGITGFQQESGVTFYFSGGSGVSVGSSSINTTAILDVQSTTKGFLPPRMTTTQRDAISSPAAGLVIYNTTTSKLQVYTTSWTDLH